MGQALYRKYRSKTLDEVVGQEHITETLKKALKTNKISHAYLFTGPRGVGKTSVARILAHEINKTNYSEKSSDIDIIEIDAASNRRIDEIRELRDKVNIAPSSSKYKIYIIDEVHMLTTPAFNALLKTLEEPPEHVVFILATTDAHKLPDTIVSRTQRYNFRPVQQSKIVSHLKFIASKESINISDDALELIAEHGEGSFRDSIGMLDQAQATSKKVELQDVQNILGIPPTSSISSLIQELNTGNSSQIIKILSNFYEQGFQSSSIASEISKQLRLMIIKGESSNRETDLALLRDLIEVPASRKPDQYLEIVLLSRQPKKPAVKPANDVDAVFIEEKTIMPQTSESQPEVKKISNSDDLNMKGSKVAVKLSPENWNLILKELKQRHNTLYGVVRMAEPKFENDKIILAFEFAFHEKKINQTDNRTVISDVIKNVTGKKYEIECILDKSATPPKIEVSTQSVKPKPVNSDISSITNIFEGAELLES